MARIIRTTGEQTDVTPRNGQSFSVDELKSFVGGWYELVHIATTTDGFNYMVVNETGLIDGLPVNEIASPFYGGYAHGYRIYGTAVMCTMRNPGMDSETLS